MEALLDRFPRGQVLASGGQVCFAQRSHSCFLPCTRRIAHAAAGVPGRAGAADGAPGGGAGQRAHRERRGGARRRAAGQSPVRRAVINAICSHEANVQEMMLSCYCSSHVLSGPGWASARSAMAVCRFFQGVGFGPVEDFLGEGLHAVLLLSRVCTTGRFWWASAHSARALCSITSLRLATGRGAAAALRRRPTALALRSPLPSTSPRVRAGMPVIKSAACEWSDVCSIGNYSA